MEWHKDLKQSNVSYLEGQIYAYSIITVLASMSQRITFCAGLWVEVVISYLSGLQPVQHIWVVQGRSGALRERNSEREILQYLLLFLVHLVDWQRQLVDPGANHDSVRLWPGLRSFLICVCWEGTLPIRPHQLLFHHIYPNTMQNCLVSVLLFLLFFFFSPLLMCQKQIHFPFIPRLLSAMKYMVLTTL